MPVKKNKRDYPRVNTFLPFEARRLHPEERQDLKSNLTIGSIVIDDSTPPLVEDERLNQWLNMLNAKLDYLISHVAPRDGGISTMAFEPLNISGSGMRVMTKENFNVSDIIEVRIVLQAYPSKILNLYGEVVRVKDATGLPGTYIVGITFLGMNEEVRSEILKFDFSKHREKFITANRS
jgi:hypothetical protein